MNRVWSRYQRFVSFQVIDVSFFSFSALGLALATIAVFSKKGEPDSSSDRSNETTVDLHNETLVAKRKEILDPPLKFEAWDINRRVKDAYKLEKKLPNKVLVEFDDNPQIQFYFTPQLEDSTCQYVAETLDGLLDKVAVTSSKPYTREQYWYVGRSRQSVWLCGCHLTIKPKH